MYLIFGVIVGICIGAGMMWLIMRDPNRKVEQLGSQVLIKLSVKT